MDSLSLEEKAELSKTSTERLKAKLVGANVSGAIFVNAVDRTQMFDAVAKLKHPPVVTPVVAAATALSLLTQVIYLICCV